MTQAALVRVLVVDDEPGNLGAIRRAFRKELAITTASSGPEAIARLEHETFDVILADFAMPGMNGIELLRQASIVQPNAGRIMVTGHGELDEIMAAKAAGIVAVVIMKPWTKDDVLRWVSQVHQAARTRGSIDDTNTNGGKET